MTESENVSNPTLTSSAPATKTGSILTTANAGASLWGPKEERAKFAGMPVHLPSGLSESQLRSYVVYIRLEELNRRLESGNVWPHNWQGPKTSQQEKAFTDALKDERSLLVERALVSNPEYNTDVNYNEWLDRHMFGPGSRKNAGQSNASPSMSSSSLGNSNNNNYQYQEKLWIPQRDFPDVNFIGLLIGPRGNTLKKMESETGVKISIRGKGSLKEGKNDAASLAAADEELHALIMADSPDKIEAAIRIINRIIETAATTPEEANELKRIQLKELASLNGTLREQDQIICQNCGEAGHRRFECSQQRNITNNIVCRICGGAGHIASDCMHKDGVSSSAPAPSIVTSSVGGKAVDAVAGGKEDTSKLDDVYNDFLADIGVQ